MGALPVAITTDSIALRVERPPLDRDAALELAREHERHCPGDGTEILSGNAVDLLGNPFWFFWWD